MKSNRRSEAKMGNKNPMYGKQFSDEHRQKLSAAGKNRIFSEETKRKMSERMKGEKNPNYGKTFSEEYREKLSESQKGRKHSEATKHKISIAQIGNKYPLGCKRSAERRKQISEANKGNKIWLGKHHSEESKKKISEAHKGIKAYNWKGGECVKIICNVCGKERYIKPYVLKRKNHGKFCSKRCQALWNNKYMKTKNTSIEIAIEKELIRKDIPYMKQVPVCAIALVDFLLSNKIIIQCDGDYWHSKKVNKGKDIAQDTILYFKGYKVFRFTETEIKKSAKKCIDKISHFISKKTHRDSMLIDELRRKILAK